MAKGRKCPHCGRPMFAVEEKDEPKGAWVVYECQDQKCKMREKVFEDKGR